MIQGIVRGALAIMLVITLITLGLGIFVVPAAPVEAASPTGTIWAWGYNVDGELGNGTNTDSNIPVQVSLPSGVVVKDIAAGYYHSLALVASATPITTTTSISGGSASVSQNDGVTVSITGSTAPNGTGVTIIRLAVLPLLRSLVPMPALPTLSSKELLPGL